jgi:integrase/recombinase XerD
LPRHLPDCLTEAQTAALLAAFDGPAPLDLRNRAMLELLYACGLRASELVSLSVGDVNLPDAVLRCLGKGGKERVVPVGRGAVAAISRYLQDGRPALDRGRGAAALFLSSRGGRPMTRQMLWNIVVAAARRAGLWGHVHPHTLRHCFASHLLSHGAGIRSIQEMLGHADIATTQIYTHVDAARVLEVHRKFHPRR